MAKDLTGAISEEVNQHIASLLQHEPKYTMGELLQIINTAIEKAGYGEMQRLTYQALKNRFSVAGYNFKGRLSKTNGAVIQSIAIKTPPEQAALTTNDVWTEELIALIKKAQRQSLVIGNHENLTTHRSILLNNLQALDPSITKSALENYLKRNQHYGQWGISDKVRDKRDRTSVKALLRRTQDYYSKSDFYEAVGKRMQNPLTSEVMIRQRIKKLGIKVPNFKMEKPQKAKLPKKAKHYVSFARIWNNRHYIAGHDVVNALRHDHNFPQQTWSEIEHVRSKYEAYRKIHPELHSDMPRLLRRQPTTGRLVPMTPAAFDQIERFRKSRKKMRNAKGWILMSAQIGATYIPAVDTFRRIAQSRPGFEFAVIAQKFGPIKMSDGRLLSNFAPELEGCVLFEDFVSEDRKLMIDVGSFLLPTLYTKLTSPVARMKSGYSRILAGTNIEFKHLPVQDGDGTRHVMTTGTATRLVLGIDHLGNESTKGVVTQNNAEIAAWIVEFKGKKKWFARPLIMLDETSGVVYDIDPKHGGAIRYTPDCSVHISDAVVEAVAPDDHPISQYQPVVDALWGKTGIMPVLNPAEIYRHDALDVDSAACPFWLKQMPRSASLSRLNFDLAEQEVMALERQLCEQHKMVPRAKQILVAANHPGWLTTWAINCDWRLDPRNYRFGARLCSMIAEETARRETVLSAKKKSHLRHPEALEVIFNGKYPWLEALGRQDERYAKTTEKIKVCLSSHGDIGPKGKTTRSLSSFTVFGNKTQYIVGHGHTGEKLLNVWRVGVSKGAYAHYIDGPITGTDWTATTCVVFMNGQIMSIEIKYGSEWHG